MQLTRKEDISLYLYLKDIVIGPEYMEISEGETLTLVSPGVWEMGHLTNLCPLRRGRCSGLGRGVLYFDVTDYCCIFGTEQSDIVKVYKGVDEETSYSVNYIDGQILSSSNLTDYKVDYWWNYVAVIDAWPNDDVPPLPVVSLLLVEGDKLPLQLGGGDIRNAFWNIQIFGSNKGERDDLMDIIYDSLYNKRCQIYDLATGLPLGRDGTFNSSFSSNLHEYYKSLHFENVKKSLSGLPQWGFYSQEQINRYRAEITFETLPE